MVIPLVDLLSIQYNYHMLFYQGNDLNDVFNCNIIYKKLYFFISSNIDLISELLLQINTHIAQRYVNTIKN